MVFYIVYIIPQDFPVMGDIMEIDIEQVEWDS